MYWNDTMPASIKKIVHHNKKMLPNWNIIILNDKNIHSYIKQFPPKYNDITIQQKSDWIRLYLLHTYGGIWSDISIIYNDVKSIDDLWNKSSNYDMTGFYNGGKLNGIYEIIETFFLMADKKSKIISLWLQEYTNAIEEGFVEYKQRIIKEGTMIRKNNHHQHDVYFIVYYCLQHILQHLKTIPKMNLLDVDKSMYILKKKCGWANKTCRKKYFNTLKNKKPYIKLTRHDRTYLNF